LIKKDYGMGRYYYPNATNALDAKIQFLREHYYIIRHCFMNDGGKGYVLFDTHVDVNEWYKEVHGRVFYKDERVNGGF
jgi:hypothetical protein